MKDLFDKYIKRSKGLPGNVRLVTKDVELMKVPEVKKWLTDTAKAIQDELERMGGS